MQKQILTYLYFRYLKTKTLAMMITGIKNPSADLSKLGINNTAHQYWNLTPEELVEHSISKGLGVLSDTGALSVSTGEFTGRSPKDRFIVKDEITAQSVDWNDINMPFSPEKFDALHKKLVGYLEGKDVYVRDVYACADPEYRLKIRVITELPWASMFAGNMFLRLTREEQLQADPEWHVIAAPGFTANADEDGTRQHNFAIVNFTKKTIIIGGTAYTGEIKKGIFAVLNYVLPHDRGVLPMHCSANVGESGDTALFFGLSGTGKTTLSADASRGLIGDDEHGWADTSIFNFEGGCYAKTINLSEENEPEIYHAIKHGAILENIMFEKDSRKVDYSNTEITLNTRVSYPLDHIDNAVVPSVGKIPRNVFFLTYDAFGVLPPISKLNQGQAMYHFISGYTSKVAGTEEGINEPLTTFSACFGSPFLPLHPTKYAEMLGKKMTENKVKVWLINTGIVGGKYGVGKRMSLPHTRALISAALEGALDDVQYEKHDVFGIMMPVSCPNVPSHILNPRNSWEDKTQYDAAAAQLAKAFVSNFRKFADAANKEILDAAPVTEARLNV